VELAKGKYLGFNDRHLTEKLAEQEKLEISREKVRQILRSAGIASPRKRRGNKHRSRRERKAAEGMMLQVDCAPPAGEFSPRFEGSATGSFGFLNLYLVFLRG
jgi:hypothetical protein